jgi:hypothetical protein
MAVRKQKRNRKGLGYQYPLWGHAPRWDFLPLAPSLKGPATSGWCTSFQHINLWGHSICRGQRWACCLCTGVGEVPRHPVSVKAAASGWHQDLTWVCTKPAFHVPKVLKFTMQRVDSSDSFLVQLLSFYRVTTIPKPGCHLGKWYSRQ